MQATTLSFRVEEAFAERTRALATIAELRISDYMREAVREKNERVMAQRMAMLSRELAAEHLAFNESIEETLADGLD